MDCANCATRRDLRRIGHRANFSWGKTIDSLTENGDFPENEENGDFHKEIKNYFGPHARFSKVLQTNQSGGDKADLLEK